MSHLPSAAEMELVALLQPDKLAEFFRWQDRWLAMAQAEVVITHLEQLQNTEAGRLALHEERRRVALRALGARLADGDEPVVQEVQQCLVAQDAERLTLYATAVRTKPKED